MIIDMHCDTIGKIMHEGDSELKSNNLSVDINKLKKGNSLAQFFAMFIYLEKNPKTFNRAMDMINVFYREIEKNSHDIAVARNYEELMNNNKSGKISAFLTIEEGEAIEGALNNLQNFYDLGVRLMTLTWNFENSIGFPNCRKEYMNKGLKAFGIETVERMNELGMIVDTSHLSDGGFWDVARYSKKPFVASHSNCRALCGHSRNLTDDMIKTLSEKGGIMGVNFEKSFLQDEGKISSVDDMVRHIRRMYDKGGIDVIALGTDFDGIDSENLEISNIGEMDKLIDKLKISGFKESDIDKITKDNALRVIKEVL